MKEAPLVSVVIPTYNRRDEVIDAIESALGQDYPDKEVIVVDDGSTDSTGVFLKERYSGKIRYIYQENKEKSAARNRGIREAKGEFLCMLDSDDIMLPGAMKKMAGCFNAHPDADAVYGLTIRKRADGSIKKPPLERSYPDGDILDGYLKERLINNNSFMIRRGIMLRYGMYREELTNREDFELILRLASKFKFYFCGDYTCMVRRSRASAKDDNEKILRQGIKAMDGLFSSQEVSPRLLEIKGRLYADEYLTLAQAAYHAARYAEFREYYRKAVSLYFPSLFRRNFLRRYALSLVMRSGVAGEG